MLVKSPLDVVAVIFVVAVGENCVSEFIISVSQRPNHNLGFFQQMQYVYTVDTVSAGRDSVDRHCSSSSSFIIIRLLRMVGRFFLVVPDLGIKDMQTGLKMSFDDVCPSI